MFELNHIHFAGEESPPPTRREARLHSTSKSAWGHGGASGHGTREKQPAQALSPLPRFILNRGGLEAECYQPKALNRRTAACLRALGVSSEEAGIAALNWNPELAQVLLSSVLIGVSEFFRDEAVFSHLKQAVLPELLEKNGALRVYSAGCSAGHELYSMAMILDEIGRLESSQLLGVDCRPDAIEQARAGCFAVSDLKVIGEQRQQRYFHFEGRCATISPRLRRKTAWQAADFGGFRDTKPWDLILFRNAAIYLEFEYANSVWHRLDQQLKPGGFVVTGSADRPPGDLGWRRESACIYRKPLPLTS